MERSLRLALDLREYLSAQGDEVVVVDADSSDRLLMLLLEKRGREVLDRHPAGPGMGRPPRIASVARRFLEMVEGNGQAGEAPALTAHEAAIG